ncbi:DUF4197 domain-containing protein [Paracidovorax sp. MALMAid1276]|uniref:DUF4197 domain-containing protein n=1 Tax=Paracidovorax sp. MALMAid1276 TaxID=3411631 RepID=UPI003B9D27B6
MHRRQFHHATAAALWGAWALATPATAQSSLTLASLTSAEASRGVKAALTQGAQAAVQLLGRTDGFLGNPRVRIGLPGYLEDAGKVLRSMGQGRRVDELVTAMNRAAEAAVPLGKDLLVQAVQTMTVTDAKNILTGGSTSVTAFFAEKTRAALAERFLPVVQQATDQVGLAARYNAVAGKAASFGLLRPEESNVAQYVTGKTLDGLYTIIGEEERRIRQNPAGAGSDILRRVFGVLR